MAMMNPPTYYADYDSRGEEWVFATLRDSAPDDWIVIHSLDIAPAIRRSRGEADFVVLVPDLGLMVLEVKTVARQNADMTWYYGSDNPRSPKSPFQQASGAMWSIVEYLSKEVPRNRPYVTSAVVTPFGDIRPASGSQVLEWNEWQAIGETAIGRYGLSGAIERAFKRESELTATGRTFRPEAISRCLRKQVEYYQSPAARRQRLDEEVKKYTEEQFDVLDDFRANGQLVVDGLAGTGKTILAIEACRRESQLGRSVLLLCFNRHLAKMLHSEMQGMPTPATTSSVHSLIAGLASIDAASVGVADYWNTALPELALDALLDSPLFQSFDTVVVDEAQDVIWAPYLQLISACLRGELASGRWLFLGDLAKQDIFLRSEGDPAQILESFVGQRVHRRPMRNNCRNTRSVAAFAERVGNLGPEGGYSRVLRPDPGEPPELIPVQAGDEAAALLCDILSELRDDGYKNDEIVVLSMCRGADSTAERVARDARLGEDVGSWRSRMRPYSHGQTGFIQYETLRRFKGLEAPIVIVTDVDMDTVDDDLFASLVYVGATRAQDRLIVMASPASAASLQA